MLLFANNGLRSKAPQTGRPRSWAWRGRIQQSRYVVGEPSAAFQTSGGAIDEPSRRCLLKAASGSRSLDDVKSPLGSPTSGFPLAASCKIQLKNSWPRQQSPQFGHFRQFARRSKITHEVEFRVTLAPVRIDRRNMINT